MLCATFALLAACGDSGAQSPFTWRSPLPQGDSLCAVVWTGTQAVAVGSTGRVLVSPDGLSWTVGKAGTQRRLSGIAWTGTQLVDVGDSGVVVTSPDAVTWTQQVSGTTRALYSVCAADTMLVAAGDRGTVRISPFDRG